MSDMPKDLFTNPAWHALKSKHRHLALAAGEACRYPGDVAPFAAVATPSAAALQSLLSLLQLDERVWLPDRARLVGARPGNHAPGRAVAEAMAAQAKDARALP